MEKKIAKYFGNHRKETGRTQFRLQGCHATLNIIEVLQQQFRVIRQALFNLKAQINRTRVDAKGKFGNVKGLGYRLAHAKDNLEKVNNKERPKPRA